MDDWQPEDLALCVDDTDHPGDVNTGWNVRKGGVYTVAAVMRHSVATFLDLFEDPVPAEDSAWDAIRFRKIRPLTDEERDSFLADLGAPVSPAVPSDGRKVVALHNAGGGHTPTPTPAVALSATTLPEGARAPNREALSGFLFNPVHGGVV